MNIPRQSSGPVGYAWVRDQLGVPSFLGSREARIANVAGVERLAEGALLVPPRVAPSGTLLAHLLFALKHEEVNLHLLTLGLKRVPAAELEAEFAGTPNGAFIRMACHLWEHANGQALRQPDGVALTAPYVPVFPPAEYVTGASRRNQKWRVDFNGLGDLGYCPIVRRTPTIQAFLAEDVLARAREFAANTSKAMLDRALSWAYLGETEGSFAIEKEVPTQGKAAAFAKLLQHAHDPRKLTEDYLCSLQNVAISNPLDKAVQFRSEQNRLQRGGHSAAGVTYVPPPPDLALELMAHVVLLANDPPGDLDPLIHAALVSFGFVYVHPFMDGNGRLSRYLIHHCLGQSGRLPQAFVLPVSLAMKRHEDAYLEALRSFSKPARELCDVTWLGGDQCTFDWHADFAEAFRYVDTTACVEFTFAMAKAGLEEDLRREARFLVDFDRVFDAIDERFDLRSSDLSSLIVFAFEQGGRISNKRRKQYADRVPAPTLDAIEAEVRKRIEGRDGDAS